MPDSRHPIVACLRLPRQGPDGPLSWPDSFRAGEQLVRTLLIGGHSGRQHLPAALHRCAPYGLPLLVVQQQSVVAAFRLVHLEPVDLAADASLSRTYVGTAVLLRSSATVQIWTHRPERSAGDAPADLPRIRLPGHAGSTAYGSMKAAMDVPPSL